MDNVTINQNSYTVIVSAPQQSVVYTQPINSTVVIDTARIGPSGPSGPPGANGTGGTANTGHILFSNSTIYSNNDNEVLTLLSTSDGLNIFSSNSFVQLEYNSNPVISEYGLTNSSWLWLDQIGFYLENYYQNNFVSGIYANKNGTVSLVSYNNFFTIENNVLTLPFATSIVANSTAGIDGQVLTSNGSAVYWGNVATGGGGTGNADAAYANAVSYVDGKSYVNTSQLSSNLSVFQTTAGLAANVLTLQSNSAAYINANTGIISNSTGVFVDNSLYVNSSNLSSNLNNYVTTTNLTNNLANYVTTTNLTNNLTNYVTTTNLTNNLANYATISSVTANAGAAYTNAVSYVDGKSYVNTSQLTSNLSNYALLTGATFTGNVIANNANTTYDLNVGRNLTVGGNLTITGNVTVLGSNNLSIVDNFIYINSNNTSDNIDIGIAANYNDGTYHHTGIFRDASDGVWKVFDNYAPEPDANVNIDTTNTTFHIANFQANVLYIGNTSVYSTVNTTNFTGQSNTANLAYYIIANTGIVSNSTGVFVDNTLYVNTSLLSSNLANYVTSTNLTNNLANYVTSTNLTNNLSNYQTTAGLSANVSKLSANYASFILSNNGIISNSSGVFVNGNTGLVVNSTGVFVNNTLYVNSTSLSSNLNNYSLLSGASFTNNISVANTLTVTKHAVLGGVEETFLTYANANGVFSFDCTNSTIFYLTTPAAAFTPSLTNVTLANNSVSAFTFFINQGATPYITTSNVQVGSSTNTTINWQGGLSPSGTANKKDVITLSILNVSGTYTVIGQLTTFG